MENAAGVTASESDIAETSKEGWRATRHPGNTQLRRAPNQDQSDAALTAVLARSGTEFTCANDAFFGTRTRAVFHGGTVTKLDPHTSGVLT